MSDQILERINSQLDVNQLKDLAVRLVKKPSQQTDQLEYDPQVKSFIKDTLAEELKARNLTPELDDMGNLICRIGNPESKKKIFFLGYAMTHPASSMTDPFKGEVVTEEGREAIRGRGISEQKGSLSAMLSAVDLINQNQDQLDGELIFAVSLAGETGRHDSIDSLYKTFNITADLGVVGIGTNSHICQGNKGRVDIYVDVFGESCHSSTPSQGINAIDGACAVIHKLQKFDVPGEHPELGRPTLTSTSIKSFPDATHTVQNECKLVYDRRLLPGDSAQKAVQGIRDEIGDIPPYRIEVSEGPVTFPSEVAQDSVVMKELGHAIKKVRGEEDTSFYSNSAIDAGYLNQQNTPAVMYGPGNMKYWHTDNEILYVDDLIEGAKIYTYLAMNYLSK